jgi:hypothetical protein
MFRFSRSREGGPPRRRRLQIAGAGVLAAVTLAAVSASSASAAGVQDSAPWGLDRIDQRSLDLDGKYHYRYTGAGVDVYLIGGGVRSTHAEFEGRVQAGGAIGFGEGAVDCDGWGTAAAGVVGGKTFGVAKGATIVSVKSYACRKDPDYWDLFDQIDWVTEDHVDGQPAVALFDLSDYSQDIDDLAEAMIDDGITVVVPAGDDPAAPSCAHSPARVTAAITVAASTSDDDRWHWTSYGRCNDLFAPGDLIRSANSADDTATDRRSGTSLAAAHVAGAAALILEQHPTYTPAQVWDAMEADATTDVMATTIDNEPDRLLHITPSDVPSKPTGLHGSVAPADGLHSGQVKLTWTGPTDDGGLAITDYVIEQSTDKATWTAVTDGESTTTAFSGGEFATGTARWFRVAAKNAAGVGATSDSIQLTPLGVPDAPTDLKAAVATSGSVGSGQVKLTWSAPAANGGAAISDYLIEQTDDGIHWATLNDGVRTATVFTVSGLANGRAHGFRVSAVNAVGTGSYVQVTATPVGRPDVPGGLTATVAPAGGVGTGQVRLSWTAPFDNGSAITDYIIEYAKSGQARTVADDGVSTATEFTLSGLKNGVDYVFVVRAKNAIDISSPSTVIHSTPAWTPSEPNGLTATVAPAPGVGSGEAELHWNAPTDDGGSAILDYVIERSTDGTTWTAVADGESTATEYTVGGLTNGVAYQFRVAAHNTVGNGPSIATLAAATPAWTPTAPDDLMATAAPADAVGSGEVRLAWNAPADNGGKAITDYRIEWSTTGDEWTVVDDGQTTATTFTISGLANFTNHLFRVRAENAVGAGPSATVEATPLGMPGAPDGLTAAVAPSVGVGEVLLTWSSRPSGEAVTDYLVESSTDGVSWTAVDDGVSSVPRSGVGGLDNGTPYQFRVAAVNAVGSGEWSSPIVATPVGKPAAPGRPRAAVAPTARVRSGQVKLTWTAPADNGSAVSDYVIQRSTDGTTWKTVRDGLSTTTTFTVPRLANGTPYQFRIAAKNAGGRGDWSTTVSATPRWKPAAPGALRARAGASQVRLTWTAPAANGAAIRDYVIQRSNGRRWVTATDGVSTARSATVARLTNGTSYRFRVAAVNAVGRGAWSVIVRATPRAAR